ncbi:MAG: virulence protein [Acutalibacteraceae bacterium]
MRFEFNKTGADRKALVTAIGEILGTKPKYMGMPTAAYDFGGLIIDKNGGAEFEENIFPKDIEDLIDRLADRGFIAAETPCNATNNEVGKLSETTENKPHSENVGLTVEVPSDSVNTKNLAALLGVKGELIKKALRTDSLDFKVVGDRVSFHWFQNTDIKNADTYTKFISALCKMSKDQKRINKTESNAENEKYAFRCFLLRLGFIGNEYKNDRKVLLKNLTGSSAFKGGNR